MYTEENNYERNVLCAQLVKSVCFSIIEHYGCLILLLLEFPHLPFPIMSLRMETISFKVRF